MKINKNYLIQFLIAFLLFMVNQGLFVGLIGGEQSLKTEAGPDVLSLATAAAAAISLLFILISNRKQQENLLKDLGCYQVGKWYQWVVGFILFFGYGYLVQWGIDFFNLPQTDFVERMKDYQHLGYMLIGIGVLGPFFEEVLMRGLLYAGIQLKNKWLHGLLISTVFTLPHIQYAWHELAALFGMAMVLYFTRAWSKSIWLPIAIHVCNNTLVFL